MDKLKSAPKPIRNGFGSYNLNAIDFTMQHFYDINRNHMSIIRYMNTNQITINTKTNQDIHDIWYSLTNNERKRLIRGFNRGIDFIPTPFIHFA